MEKILQLLAVITIVFVSIFFTENNAKPPTDPTYYEGYRWTAQETNIYFDVSESYYDISSGSTMGIAVINGEEHNITATTSYSWNLDIDEITKDTVKSKYKTNLIIMGKIKSYDDNKFILDIYEEYRNFFGEEIKSITFVREPTPGYVEYVKPE